MGKARIEVSLAWFLYEFKILQPFCPFKSRRLSLCQFAWKTQKVTFFVILFVKLLCTNFFAIWMVSSYSTKWVRANCELPYSVSDSNMILLTLVPGPNFKCIKHLYNLFSLHNHYTGIQECRKSCCLQLSHLFKQGLKRASCCEVIRLVCWLVFKYYACTFLQLGPSFKDKPTFPMTLKYRPKPISIGLVV